MSDLFTIALISDVFFDDSPSDRLKARLEEARGMGAELAVLPELPCNAWRPSSKIAQDDDAESPEGPRWSMQAQAAADVGIGLVGGAIVIDPTDGTRHNTALVFAADGTHLGSYEKCHIPCEPGFWESSHYEPGRAAPTPIDGFSMPLGVQICSDINRPQGCQLLGAAGAELIVAPRATEMVTLLRWRPVFIANALTTSTYIASVNRPRPEDGVWIGGHSIVVSPTTDVLVETREPVAVATLDRNVIRQARIDYPGYLDIRSDLYADAWANIADAQRTEPVKTVR